MPAFVTIRESSLPRLPMRLMVVVPAFPIGVCPGRPMVGFGILNVRIAKYRVRTMGMPTVERHREQKLRVQISITIIICGPRVVVGHSQHIGSSNDTGLGKGAQDHVWPCRLAT